MGNFDILSEREILALAISLEEEDEGVYADYAEGLRQEFPSSAALFGSMSAEVASHGRWLLELYQERWSEHSTLIVEAGASLTWSVSLAQSALAIAWVWAKCFQKTEALTAGAVL